MSYKQSQYNPIGPDLIEIAYDLVRGEKITLKTDKGWFDEAELYLYWHANQFECVLTITEVGPTETGPTWYDPPEPLTRETTHEGSFRKIREVNEWAKQHHFEIDSAWRTR